MIILSGRPGGWTVLLRGVTSALTPRPLVRRLGITGSAREVGVTTEAGEVGVAKEEIEERGKVGKAESKKGDR